MASEDAMTRALAITDASLRTFFPNDFYKRCMYAAFGLSALLQDAGISTRIIGGDFLCALVSTDGMQMSLQGFGSFNQNEPSHFWVEARGFMLDLGPTYLPYESSFPAPSPPILRRPISTPQPNFLCYREKVRFSKEFEISTPEIRQRIIEFIDHCRRINQSKADRALPNMWLLKDYQSLQHAANKRDPWAIAAIRFLNKSLKAEFPQ